MCIGYLIRGKYLWDPGYLHTVIWSSTWSVAQDGSGYAASVALRPHTNRCLWVRGGCHFSLWRMFYSGSSRMVSIAADGVPESSLMAPEPCSWGLTDSLQRPPKVNRNYTAQLEGLQWAEDWSLDSVVLSDTLHCDVVYWNCALTSCMLPNKSQG